jgi:hypothetical protein
MNKQDAANYLGISTRALEYHVKQKNIGRRMVPGKTGEIADFDEGELRKLKAKLDAKREPVHAVMREGAESPEAEPRSLARLSDVAPVMAWLERIAPARGAQNHAGPSISDLACKLFLSEREASIYSGLPLAEIRAARKALKTAKHGRGYKLKREVLEAWVRKL